MFKRLNKETNYKDVIFKHKLQTFYRVVLILVLIAVIAIFVKVRIDNQVYTKFEIAKTMDRVGTKDSVFKAYQNNLLVYSKDGISAYTQEGSQMWNQTYEMQSPIVRISGQYVVVGDYKGSTIYLISAKGPVTTVETNMPILDLSVSSQGIIAASLQDDKTTCVKLFSHSGELISDISTSMRLSGYPIAFAISPDSIKVGVSYLKAESGKINSSIAFYNFGGVGQNETDNLVSGYDYKDQVIPLMIYPNEDHAIAVGDKKLLILKGKQKPTLHKEIDLEEQVQSVYYNATNIALVFRSTAEEGGEYTIHVYDMNGDLKLTQSVDFPFTDLIVEDNRIIVYNEAKVKIVSLNGVVKYEGDLGGKIQALISADSGMRFLVVTDEGIKLIKLR